MVEEQQQQVQQGEVNDVEQSATEHTDKLASIGDNSALTSRESGTRLLQDRAFYALLLGIAALLCTFLNLLVALLLGIVAVAWGVARVRKGRPIIASLAIFCGILTVILVGTFGVLFWNILQTGRNPLTNELMTNDELRKFGLSDEDIVKIRAGQ